MFIAKGQIVNKGTYNEEINNSGIIKGGEFLGKVNNLTGSIEGGVFKATVENYSKSTITGGEFYGAIVNNSVIENAILKNGSSLTNTTTGKINKLTIDGTVKLDDNIINAATSIEMKPNSTLELDFIPDLRKFINPQTIRIDKVATINGKTLTIEGHLKTSLNNINSVDKIKMNPDSMLELDSMPDFRKFINVENIKVGNDLIIKNGVYFNHNTINIGYFNMPLINEKDGTINGGHFENIENHGTINGGTLALNLNSVEIFKNDGNINNGTFLAKNTYNSGTINKGWFNGIVHNENGTISSGKFDYIELLSGDIHNARIYRELTIKGGSVEHIELKGGFERLNIRGFPKIKNEAGVMIEKLDIWGKVKFNASELDNIESVELLQVNGYGGTILYLDALPDFSKITGHGTIKVGNASYKVDGTVISWQEYIASDFLINDSFKLYLAAEKLKEQKYLLDEQNAQNNLQNDLQVDLVATPQNSDNFVI